jgi:crotonobetainyl-CoA:carnitine CoA-transferase CaiB-like acyl-CoA transferase
MKALEGVNLLEFSSHLGGAYAAMLLAEHGASAIKVEPPGGDAARGTPHFHVVNRGKRSLFLDLESKAAGAEVRDLIRWADIVIDGHTPGRARALGLDYESICAINPRALVVTMPPLGSRGPDAELDADDLLVQARGGLAGNQFTRSGDPAPLTFPAVSYSAGAIAAAAAVAALTVRDGQSQGQLIEVPLLAGVLSIQTGTIIKHPKLVALYAEGANDPLGPIPSFRLFQASDGKYLFVACGGTVFWNKFALALNRADLVADPRFENAPWGCQPNWQTLKEILEAEIRTRTREEWLRILAEGDVPVAPVLTRQEFIEDSQVRFLNMRREVVDPTLGPTVQMGVSITLHDTPGEIAGPAPALDSRIRSATELIAEANPATPDDARPRERSPIAPIGSRAQGPLAGVLVLDFASYIAGSYGPMILAQMGADVIKVESMHGDSVRHLALGFLGWNQGKRGVAIKLDSPEGREMVYGLVRKADILVENLRPGRMRKLGLDYETLAARNPRLIYVSVSAFGSAGPQHNQPGFDPLLQARSGAQAAQGGHHGHPVYLTTALCDYGAAMLSALGCVLALRARQLTGRGQLCETSLLQSAMSFQAGEFSFYDGRPDMENGDAEYRGPSALSRCYRGRDGRSLAISIGAARAWELMQRLYPALAAIAYTEAALESANGALAAALERFFAGLDRDEALRRLASAGVPATPVNRIRELFADPQIAGNELLAEVVHPQWGAVTQTGRLAKFSAATAGAPRAAPTLGEHTDEILAHHLGYDSETIADLRKRGLVR